MPKKIAATTVTELTAAATETASIPLDVLERKPAYGSPRYRIHVDRNMVQYSKIYGAKDYPPMVVHDAKYPGRIFRCGGVSILGESVMKFNEKSFKDGYGATMWIETDSEVRIVVGKERTTTDRAKSSLASDLQKSRC